MTTTTNEEDDNYAWAAKAACLGMARRAGNYDLFFEEENIKEAKLVCADCPVRRPCLEYAVAEKMKFGVWGGFSYAMRRKLSRRMVNNGTTLQQELEKEQQKNARRRKRKRSGKGTFIKVEL